MDSTGFFSMKLAYHLNLLRKEINAKYVKRSRKVSKTAAGQGFTLLEVLVAVVILSLAYVAILQNFSMSLGNITRISGKQDRLLENVLLLEQKMSAAEGEEYPIFLEGSNYKLVVVAVENEPFLTLKLEANQP